MKDWSPAEQPHKNPQPFPFDEVSNNPVKEGKMDLGRDWPGPKELNSPDKLVSNWAHACQEILTRVQAYNSELLEYKKIAQPVGADADKFVAAVRALNDYVRSGHEQYLEPGAIWLEAVESGGFVLALRIFGRVIDPSEVSVRHRHSSSSSFYSLYSPPA